MSLRQGDTRQRIKREAMRLFVEQGVQAVSVRDIAAAVGMKPPNLYAHFASRDELVRELFAEGYAAYGACLSEAVAASPLFAEQLAGMVRLICRLHDEDVVQFRFLLLSQHGGLAHVLPDDPKNPMSIVQDTVADAMTRGDIPARDPALVAAMIVGAVIQVATFILYGRVQATMGEVAEALVVASAGLAGKVKEESVLF
jgi:AcrR family transcriptional regulator